RPWDITKLQGLISQEDKDSSEGLALGIGKDGYVGFYLGDGISPDEALVHRTKTGLITPKKWTHIVAVWGNNRKTIFVNGELVAAWNFDGPLKPGPHPLRLGAMSENGAAQNFLDADLAMPAIYNRALSHDEIRARFASQGLQPPSPEGLLAHWPLNEEKGDRIADTSRNRRHGRII